MKKSLVLLFLPYDVDANEVYELVDAACTGGFVGIVLCFLYFFFIIINSGVYLILLHFKSLPGALELTTNIWLVVKVIINIHCQYLLSNAHRLSSSFFLL